MNVNDPLFTFVLIFSVLTSIYVFYVTHVWRRRGERFGAFYTHVTTKYAKWEPVFEKTLFNINAQSAVPFPKHIELAIRGYLASIGGKDLKGYSDRERAQITLSQSGIGVFGKKLGAGFASGAGLEKYDGLIQRFAPPPGKDGAPQGEMDFMGMITNWLGIDPKQIGRDMIGQGNTPQIGAGDNYK